MKNANLVLVALLMSFSMTLPMEQVTRPSYADVLRGVAAAPKNNQERPSDEAVAASELSESSSANATSEEVDPKEDEVKSEDASTGFFGSWGAWFRGR